ncbi:MAG TPA: O-antigen ligase family protein [Patescibacteria group bacterium]|nr:O-antigen ligase family protein [Patescibacteria group bacterium]
MWVELATLLIIGYLCASRSFAYLGLPWISLYIGEIALAAFLLFGPQTSLGPWLRVVQRAKRLRRFECLLLVFLLYGAFQALHGVLSGYPALTAARDTAFNYYPLFLLLGVWVGLKDKDFLRRVIRMLGWWNGCYGTAWVLLLSQLQWKMPGTASAASMVPLFGQPAGSMAALLGLIAFEPRLRKVWHLIALNAFVLLGVQVRAEWAGFVVGLLVFAWLTKRLRHMVAAGALVIALLGVLYVTNFNLPAAATRGGRISIGYIAARAVAPINQNLADNLAPSKSVNNFAATANWRLVWWASIWETVHARAARALLGLGYGYPIGNLNPLIPPGEFIQTPHSDFFYALGFSGWVGVILFGLLQIELLRLLWRSYRVSGQSFGMMFWGAALAASLFEEFFEGPFAAIPFYLLIGAALAPGLLATNVARAPKAARRNAPRFSPEEEG